MCQSATPGLDGLLIGEFVPVSSEAMFDIYKLSSLDSLCNRHLFGGFFYVCLTVSGRTDFLLISVINQLSIEE